MGRRWISLAALVRALAIAAGVLVFCAPLASAQTPQQQRVTAVEFTGLVHTSTTYANSVVHTAEGGLFDPAQADADVTRLLATGRFATVTYRTEPREGGVAVIFDIQERPTITEIRFVGNEKFADSKLRESVPLKVGDPVDLFAVREGQDAITLLYRDTGYGRVQVTCDEDLLRRTGELVYTIEEGPRIRIRQIDFEGNEHFTDRELNKHITSKTYLWIFREGNFDEDTVEADAAALQNFYRDQGYLDARVSYRLDFARNQQDVVVTFVISEGVRYMVESISFQGNTVFTDAELSAMCSLVESGPMLQDRLDRSVRRIREEYGKEGYIYADVRATRVFSEQPRLVLVRIDIDEKDQYRVGRIVVRGNEQTKDKVVRRAFDLYPGDVFDLSKARKAEQDLRQLQIFSLANVTPVGEEPGVRDVLMQVEESRKAGDFLFGFGVTSNSGLVGSIMLDLKNFDLYDYPRSFSEFFRLRSFHGAGQRMRIEAQPGTELTRFRIDFTEPYLLDKPVRFDTSFYYFQRGRDDYDETRIGGNVSFGKRLARGPLKNWYGEIAFRLEEVSVDDVHLFAARDIHDDEGSTVLTSVKLSLVRDRTDNRFMPTKGDRLRLAYEQFGLLGGVDPFGEATAGYTWHTTVYTDALERKHVLSLRANAGYIVGDAPVYERFYAGGIGSMRGFQFRGVSPRQGLRDNAVGGEFMLLGGGEYSFPLYGELLRGLVFTDMGTVESGLEITQWRASVGAGIRLQINALGPIPMEFDVAAPVLKGDDDEEQVFSFFVGATF